MKRWHILAAASAYLLFTGQSKAISSPSSTTAERVYQSALGFVGKTTQQAGSWVDPRVSCAAVVSNILPPDLSIPKNAAVVTGGGLVGNLKNAGWFYVPRAESIPGCIVYHNATPDPSDHGKEHIGACSNQGCTTAINTKGGEVVNDNYPERFKPYIDRGAPWGGVLCPKN